MSPPAAKLKVVGGGAPGGSAAGAFGTAVRPRAATKTAQYGARRRQRLMSIHSAPKRPDPPKSREWSPAVHRRAGSASLGGDPQRVADAPDRVDQRRVNGVDLVPEVADVGLEHAGI